MGEELTNWILIGLGLAILAYKLWSWFTTFRRSRSARKAYDALSDQQKRELDSDLFKRDPTVAAFAKPIPAGQAIFIGVSAILLGALLVYLKFRFTGR